MITKYTNIPTPAETNKAISSGMVPPPIFLANIPSKKYTIIPIAVAATKDFIPHLIDLVNPKEAIFFFNL